MVSEKTVVSVEPLVAEVGTFSYGEGPHYHNLEESRFTMGGGSGGKGMVKIKTQSCISTKGQFLTHFGDQNN